MTADPTRWTARAPGKTNLCLFLGEARADGLHELVSVVEPLSLADELLLEPARPGAQADEVSCPRVAEPNLAAKALAAWRAASGWDAPPQHLRIHKAVPIAGGMGGGSGDAAAALRLAAAAAGRAGDPLLHELAPQLGADVPAQVRPGPALVTGAGERVEPQPKLYDHVVLVVPDPEPLPTAAVFAEADRLGLARGGADLSEREAAVRDWLRTPGARPPDELLVNDLEPAARSLRPRIDEALAEVRAAGATVALVSGSGPTVVGIFDHDDARAAARAAAAEIARRRPRTCAVLPVDADWARAHPVVAEPGA
jgi:4-diphosphocytidyl-2-C-methyl-D-erythritol kinase